LRSYAPGPRGPPTAVREPHRWCRPGLRGMGPHGALQVWAQLQEAPPPPGLGQDMFTDRNAPYGPSGPSPFAAGVDH